MSRVKGTKSGGLSTKAADTAEKQFSVSQEERQKMIAEAAYFRALERGFHGGDPMDDWLVAEAEINQSLLRLKQH